MADPLVQQGEVWKNEWQKVVIISSFCLNLAQFYFCGHLYLWRCFIDSVWFSPWSSIGKKKKKKLKKLKLVFTTSASYGPN